MPNITPTPPPLLFGYWRPWKEDSNVFDSFLDFTKDVTLVKYGADTVGKYINQTSKEQVSAINNVGQKLGLGMNVLTETVGKGFNILSNQMASVGKGINMLSKQMENVSQELFFLNRNLTIFIEQQKLTNLLLGNVAELLRVPDSEKERQHNIELGIKFFVNAQKDDDLFADALEELLQAEELMKQDYFVLHRIGLIYMHSKKHINPHKALEYFTRAAKYASVESDPKAAKLVNMLISNPIDENKRWRELKEYENNYNCNKLFQYENYNGWYINKDNFLLYTVSDKIHDGYNCEEFEKIYFNDLIKKTKTNDKTKKKLIEIQKNIDKINSKYESGLIGIDKIQLLASDSYSKAAFAAYVLGDFEMAVTNQTKAQKYNNSSENQFMLAKYLARTKQIDLCVQNLSESIDINPTLALAVFIELDLMNEPAVLKLIEEKNNTINEKINLLIIKFSNTKADSAKKAIIDLNKLQGLPYNIKIEKFNKLNEEKFNFDDNLEKLKQEIGNLKKKIDESFFCTYSEKDILSFIDQLIGALQLPFEKMKTIYDTILKKYDLDILKIGSKYAGGIVFYIDKSKKNGLVCAETDLGRAIWSSSESELLGTKKNIGYGKANTKLIVDKYLNGTAAKLCNDLSLNGFNDWFLPSSDELNLIYKNLHLSKIGNFISTNYGYYWSSSEEDKKKALMIVFRGNDEIDRSLSTNKKNDGLVRAVRVFNFQKGKSNIEAELENDICLLKENLSNPKFCSNSKQDITAFKKQLNEVLQLPFEEKKLVYNNILKKCETEILKIGSKYAGGIVFYIDESGKHGLVCAEVDLGQAVWGGDGELGTKTFLGSGKTNTKLIVDNVSYFIKKGFFSDTKIPAPTAARICMELILNGFNDWFLPSKDELNLIYKNLIREDTRPFEKDDVIIKNKDNNKHCDYWSSSEDTNGLIKDDRACSSYSNQEYWGNRTKLKNVLPIRAF